MCDSTTSCVFTVLLSLQHLVDLFGQYYGLMRHLLPRLLLLLRGFISRSHSSLASVGVAAYARLVSSCGKQLDADGWAEVRDWLLQHLQCVYLYFCV